MRAVFALGAALALASSAAFAVPTGSTGGGQPFDNMQPSLVVTQVTPLNGIYPSTANSFAAGGTMGFIYGFAGNYAPNETAQAQGQSRPIADNLALFTIIGTIYGGDGVTTFDLPDLGGRAPIGTGSGGGLSPQDIGQETGSTDTTLSVGQLPAHAHSMPGGGSTSFTGSNVPFENMQPTLALTQLIATEGVFPTQNGGGSAAFIGQMGTFAGVFAPGGWVKAEGQLLDIATYEALFNIIGTTYGGDGQLFFAVPDLRGRVIVGADAEHEIGTTFGDETNTLSIGQMPAHTHTTPGGDTGATGGGALIGNVQPSLAMNYLIATQGVFPSQNGGGVNADEQFLGQIIQFAGQFVPAGWALANGALLSIADNQALFAIIGTTYGGDGQTEFALPDFRGRTMLGAGNGYVTGQVVGIEESDLDVANLAAHVHQFELVAAPEGVPTPGALALLAMGLLGFGAARRRVSLPARVLAR